ncbi:anti-sigma factor family protein [Aminobacter sp. Piv2-1]|uniref:anti-sigma factor family protein n=1 Tax=Aminobacter sp. Piv2-1 TaxID=3031122 RepID=UPI0030B48E45
MIARPFTERDIHLALDGELPEDERAAYQAWLDANPDMKARSQRYAADQAALRGAFASVLDEKVPARLTAAVDGEAPMRRPASQWWRMAAAAALLVAGGLAGYLVGSNELGFGPHDDDRVAEDALAAHATYIADAAHPVEVSGENPDYLTGWLSKRTGLKLIAPDLATSGFKLVGGRVLPAKHGTAALMIYEDGQGERISVYVTAEGGAKAKGTYGPEDGGARAVYWLDQGYACAIVGNLPQERLSEVARDAYKQLLAGAGMNRT